ncbi:MAG: tetratricopeptide repeat protein, partial [Gammaproteobacteria bacterium]
QPIDLRAIRERFSEMPLVTEDLKNIFIEEPGDIYVRIMQTGKELRENYGAAGVISDENNHLEQMFPGWGRIPAISYDPIRVVDEVGREFPGVASEMGPLVRNLARIHFRVPDFPLYDVRSDPRVKYSQVDWSRVTRLKRAGEELLGRGNTSGAIDSFLKALKIVPEHGLLLSFVGQLYSQANQPGDAEVAFRRLVDLEPSNASVWAWLAQAIAQQGRGREAIEMFRRSLDINPELQDAVQGLAWILVTHPDPQVRSESEGLDLAEKSNLIAKGRSTKALSTLAAAYSANNRFDEAIEVSNTGLALARSNKDGFTGAKIRRELLLYQEGIPVIDWSFVR